MSITADNTKGMDTYFGQGWLPNVVKQKDWKDMRICSTLRSHNPDSSGKSMANTGEYLDYFYGSTN